MEERGSTPPVSFSEVLANIQNKIDPDAVLPSQAGRFQPPVYAANPLLFSSLGFNPALIKQPSFAGLAATSPDQMVSLKGYQMTAATAAAFEKLEGLIGQRFPGREVSITSTTDGTHVDPNHYKGKAVDFVVDGLTKEESLIVEQLAGQSGFKPYNEYIYSSPHKTGDHMHVDLQG